MIDEESEDPHYEIRDVDSASTDTNESKCMDCNYGYMLKTDGTCEACHATCQECENDGSDN